MLALLPAAGWSQALDSGDTAWMLTSTALVLFMTLPGLALFYAGLVRNRNVLSVVMQCFTIACMVSVIWVVCGYSLAFGESVGGYVGGLSAAWLSGVTIDSLRRAPCRKPSSSCSSSPSPSSPRRCSWAVSPNACDSPRC